METLTRRRAGIFRWIVLTIFAAVTLCSCALFNRSKTLPSPERRVEEIFPLVPFTRKIMRQVNEEGRFALSDFQFYLSSGIVLERYAQTGWIQIYPQGEGEFRRQSELTGMNISSGTQGILTEVTVVESNTTILEVYFDERYRNNTLRFVESPVDFQYYLDYNEANSTMEINGVIYALRYVGEMPPYLFVRLKNEPSNLRPQIVTMRGAELRRVRIDDDCNLPKLNRGRSTNVEIPIVNYQRTPVIVQDVELSTDPDFAVIQQPLQPGGVLAVGEPFKLNYRITVKSNCPPGWRDFTLIYTFEENVVQREYFHIEIE